MFLLSLKSTLCYSYYCNEFLLLKWIHGLNDDIVKNRYNPLYLELCKIKILISI